MVPFFQSLGTTSHFPDLVTKSTHPLDNCFSSSFKHFSTDSIHVMWLVVLESLDGFCDLHLVNLLVLMGGVSKGSLTCGWVTSIEALMKNFCPSCQLIFYTWQQSAIFCFNWPWSCPWATSYFLGNLVDSTHHFEQQHVLPIQPAFPANHIYPSGCFILFLSLCQCRLDIPLLGWKKKPLDTSDVDTSSHWSGPICGLKSKFPLISFGIQLFHLLSLLHPSLNTTILWVLMCCHWEEKTFLEHQVKPQLCF